MDAERISPRGWLVVALLFFFMFVNFADKAVLGLTAVPMMRDLHLTPRQFGMIGSSFFLLFSASAIVVGFLVNRIQARWAILVMAVIWALAQFPLLGATGLATLMVSRIALGAGEGPAYPVAVHAAYKWIPDAKRAVPTAFIAQGAAIGVVIALPALGWVIARYSWRWAYGVLGIAGLIWCVLWLAFGREGTLQADVRGESGLAIERVPYARLIFNPTMLALILTAFGAYWGLSLLVAWFPPFLIVGLGITPAAASIVAAVPWAAGAIIVILGSALSQRCITRGVSSRVARAILGGAFVIAGGIALVVMPYASIVWLKVLLVVLGISLPSVIYVVGPAMIGEMVPVGQRGAMLAIYNATVTLAGLIAPYAMGSAVQNAASASAGYVHGFFVCGVLTLAGGVIGMAFMRPADEIRRFDGTAALHSAVPVS